MAREVRPHFDIARAFEALRAQSAARDEIAEASFELLGARLDAIQRDVRQGNLDRDALGREVGELQRQMIDTREELQRHKSAEAQAAARGASEGAVAGMASERITPAVKAAMRKAPTPRATWVVMSMVGLLWLTTFVEKAPAVFRAVAAFFTGVSELDK